MSTTYKFFTEVFYAGKWYNIDYLTKGAEGELNHQYLVTLSRSRIGLLAPLIPSGRCLNFEELAETSQALLLEETSEEYEDYMRLGKYFVLGSWKDLECISNSPYMYQGFITRNDVARLEEGNDEEPPEILTVRDLLALPEEARSEYVLFKWDNPYESRKILRKMVDTVIDQVAAFNKTIPVRRDVPVKDLMAAKTRILYYTE